MYTPAFSIEAYCSVLASIWGVDTRHEEGTQLPLNAMPIRSAIRDTLNNKNAGNRFILNEKRMRDAIVKSSINMILNGLDHEHPCVPLFDQYIHFSV